jgi:hypothetical protein
MVPVLVVSVPALLRLSSISSVLLPEASSVPPLSFWMVAPVASSSSPPVASTVPSLSSVRLLI